jgi:hypothetical protein
MVRCFAPSLAEVYSDLPDTSQLNASQYALSVAISFNGQQYTAQDVDFFYYAVHRLIPSHGPLEGGQLLRCVRVNV